MAIAPDRDLIVVRVSANALLDFVSVSRFDMVYTNRSLEPFEKRLENAAEANGRYLSIQIC